MGHEEGVRSKKEEAREELELAGTESHRRRQRSTEIRRFVRMSNEREREEPSK